MKLSGWVLGLGLGLVVYRLTRNGSPLGNMIGGGAGGAGGSLFDALLGNAADSVLANNADPTTDEDVGVAPETFSVNLTPGVLATAAPGGVAVLSGAEIQTYAETVVRSGGSGIYKVPAVLGGDLDAVIMGVAKVVPGSIIKPGAVNASGTGYDNATIHVPGAGYPAAVEGPKQLSYAAQAIADGSRKLIPYNTRADKSSGLPASGANIGATTNYGRNDPNE